MAERRTESRWIYVALAVSVTIPFLFHIPLPMPVSKPVQSTFDCVEALAMERRENQETKIALLVADWEPATMAEITPQVKALIYHFMSREIPFAIIGFRPTGPGLAQDIAEEVASSLNKTYGQDWCNWGYKTQMDTTIQSMLSDFQAVISEDTFGKPLDEIPMLTSFEGMADIGLAAEFTGSGGMLQPWVEFVHAENNTPILHGCTGVLEARIYPLLASGQIDGFVSGLSGAAQYEQLVEQPGKGSQGMAAQSLAHLLIIGLIALVNGKELLNWWRRRSWKD